MEIHDNKLLTHLDITILVHEGSLIDPIKIEGTRRDEGIFTIRLGCLTGSGWIVHGRCILSWIGAGGSRLLRSGYEGHKLTRFERLVPIAVVWIMMKSEGKKSVSILCKN